MGTAVASRSRVLSGIKTSTRWKVAEELFYVVAFWYLYELIRGAVVQSGALATRHGLLVVDIEKSLGIFHERWLQSLFLPYEWLIKAFNLYYGGTHFLVPIATLVWIGVRHSDQYPKARNLLAVTTAIGFFCFWLYPVAPPRLLPTHFGFVDTIRNLGGTRVEGALMDRAGNAYAALPSLHTAWAVWSTIALYPLLQHRWSKVVAIAYPIMTALVVVVSGNHYIADCVTGAMLVGAVAWALNRIPAGAVASVVLPWRGRTITSTPNPAEETR